MSNVLKQAAAKGGWGKLNFYGDLSYVSSYYTFPYPLVTSTASDQNANSSKSKGRTMVNLRLAVADIPLGGASVVVENNLGKLVALLPAHVKGINIYSHFGLTYGGMVVAEKCTSLQWMKYFLRLKGRAFYIKH